MAATAEAQSALREQLLAEQEQSVREAFQRHRLAAPATCSHCDYPGMCISAADSFVVDKQGLSLPPLVPLEPLLPIGATELLQAPQGRRHVGRVFRGTVVAPPFVQTGTVITLVEEEGGGGLVPLCLLLSFPPGQNAKMRLEAAVALVVSGMRTAIVEPLVAPLPSGRVGVSVNNVRDLLRGSDALVGVGAPTSAPVHVLEELNDAVYDLATLRRVGEQLLREGSLIHAESVLSGALTIVDNLEVRGREPGQHRLLSAALCNEATGHMRVAARGGHSPLQMEQLRHSALAAAAAAVAVDVSYARAHARLGAALAAGGEPGLAEWCNGVARRIDAGFAPRAVAGDDLTTRRLAKCVAAAAPGFEVPVSLLPYPEGDDLDAAQRRAHAEKERGNQLFGSEGAVLGAAEQATMAYKSAARCLAAIAAPLLLLRAECRSRMGRFAAAMCDAAAACVVYPEVCGVAAEALIRIGDVELNRLQGVPATTEEGKQKVCGFCDAPLPDRKSRMKCAGCLSVYYCGADCQKQHWREHKGACRAAKAGKA